MNNSFEREMVQCFNRYFTEHRILGLAYRLKQSNFATQYVDIVVDSRYPGYYLSVECKSLKGTRLSFSSNFHEHMDDNIGIFLVEIGLWEIDDSKPAANFNVIERPNDWAKAVKSTENLTDKRKMNLAFWQEFGDYARTNQKFIKEFKVRKAQPQHWYDLAVGSSSYHITMTMNTRDNKLTCGIYIDDNKELYAAFESHNEDIERESGIKYDWQLLPEKKASRVEAYFSCHVQNEKKWSEYFEWLCSTSLKTKKAFLKWG